MESQSPAGTDNIGSLPRPALPDRPYHKLSVIPDIDQRIIDGIISGKTLRALAQEFDVSNVAILKRARQHSDYRDALEACKQMRMEDCVEKLESAADNVSVTRADRLLGQARWDAERSCPDRWGQAKPGGCEVNVQIVLRGSGDVVHGSNGSDGSGSHVITVQASDA